MPSTNPDPDQVRMVSPSGTSWVTASPAKAARLRALGFRPVADKPEPAPPVKRAPRKRVAKKAAE